MLDRLGTWIEGRRRDNAVEVQVTRSILSHRMSRFRGTSPHYPHLQTLFLPSPPFMVHGEPLAHPLPLPPRFSPARFARRFSSRT